MKLNKRSCFAEVMGAYFEVPDRTKWIFIDPVCRVFAVCSDTKPKPSPSCPLPLWDYDGDAVYIGMVRMFKFDDWRNMVFDVRGKLVTRDQYVAVQIKNALEYAAERVAKSDSMGAAYCAQVVRLVAEQLKEKKFEVEND